jgi:hypothetical protein
MNKILYIFILSLVISCDSNDLEDTPTDEQPTSQVMDLEATGTLANETIEKAKEIIYGRWNLSNGSETGSSNMSIAKNTIVSPTSCGFEYIEFTDENYILGLAYVKKLSNSIFDIYNLQESTSTLNKEIGTTIVFNIGIKF